MTADFAEPMHASLPYAQETNVLHSASWWQMTPYWLHLSRGARMHCGAYVIADDHLDDTAPDCPDCAKRHGGTLPDVGNTWPIRRR
jgi:hypothetical protein